MRLVVQRVTRASVTVDGEVTGKIGKGYMVLVGSEVGDTEADARHGRRPSFIAAARPEVAEPLLEQMKAMLEARGLHVETGRFQTHMDVELVNDGPVTILIDSRKVF